MKLTKYQLQSMIKEEFDNMLEDVAPAKSRFPSTLTSAERLARQATTPKAATGDDYRSYKKVDSPFKRALKRTVGSVKKSGWGGNIGPVNYKGVPQADVSVSKKFKFEEEQQIIEEELDNMLNEQDWRTLIPGYDLYNTIKKIVGGLRPITRMITDPLNTTPVDRGQPHDEWMKEYEFRKEWAKKVQGEIIINMLRDIRKKNPPPKKQERLPYVHYDE